MRQTLKQPKSLSYRFRRLMALFTMDGFATSSLTTQGLLIFLAGFLVVFGFAPLVGSVKLSAQMFMQTAGVDALENWQELIFGTIDFFIGLVIFSLVITLLSNALTQFVSNVKEGTLRYTGTDHLVIINPNDMLTEVLIEIDNRAGLSEEVYKIVIVAKNADSVDDVWKQLLGKKFLHLEIFLRQGNLHNAETYNRINLCKAAGVLLLQDYKEKDKFERDNDTIKTLLSLVGWLEFRATLRNRLKAKVPFKFVSEASGTVGCGQIIGQIAKEDGTPPFIPVNPLQVTDHLLARAIADARYYTIFQDLFSFDGEEIFFVDPSRFTANVEGKTFREIGYGFTKGIVLGRSCFQNGSFSIQLGPMDEVMKTGDWLIVIAEEPTELIFDHAKRYTPLPDKIPQPPEIVFRRICMLGDRSPFPSLTSFLDEESRKIFAENKTVLEDTNKYFDAALFEKIRSGQFDTVVINVEDEVAVRLAAFLLTLYKENDPFIKKIAVVIEDTGIDELLNPDSKKHNTILSRRLCAKYLTQILFQKGLVQVIDELCAPEGYEINLLEIGSDIPRDKLRSKDEVKQLMLGSDIIYMGFFDDKGGLYFDSGEFEKAKTLIVLAKGDK